MTISRSITEKTPGQAPEKNPIPITQEDLPSIPADADDDGIQYGDPNLATASTPPKTSNLAMLERDAHQMEQQYRDTVRKEVEAEILAGKKTPSGSRAETEAEPKPVDLEYLAASIPGDDWIPEYAPIPGITINRAVAIWHGAGGSSKSLFVLSASCALITGRGAICGMELTGRPKPGGGHEEIRHRVLYLSLEDPRSVIEGRIGALCSLYSIDPPQLAELLIVDREQAKPLIQSNNVYSRIMSIRKIATEIKPTPTIIFIDHMRLFDSDAELSPDSAMHTIKGLENVAADLDLAIVVLHHDRKMPPQNGQATRGDDMASGTTGLHTNSRAFAQFRATEDRGLVITGGKANYTKRFGQQEYMIDTETINGHAQPVLVAIQAPDIFDGIPAKTCKEIVKAIAEAKPEMARENNRLEGWAGAIAAGLAELDIGDRKRSNRTPEQNQNRERIQEWLSAWVRAGYLKTETVDIKSANRQKIKTIIYRKGGQKYE